MASVFEPLAGVLRALPIGRARMSRRTWVGNGRAHIEVRGVRRPRSEEEARDLEAELAKVPGVNWSEVNAVLGRVVVDFTDRGAGVEDLVAVVERVEERHGVADEPFPSDGPAYPGDPEPGQRQLVAMGADVAGIGLAAFGRLLRLARLPVEAASLLSLLDSTPRVRDELETWLGRARADVALAFGNATAQGLAQGPLGLLVDAAYRLSAMGEIAARQRVWREREPDLCGRPANHRTGILPVEPRVVPLQPGPVERYADGSGIASLLGGASTFAATRSVTRTISLLTAGTPKAARLTREAFASQLGRLAANRGILSFDGDALRRLDRVDTVVIDARVLLTGRFVVGTVVVVDGDADPETEGRLHQRADALLDPLAPRAVQSTDDWMLAPLTEFERPLTPEAQAAARRLRRQGTVVLGLLGQGTVQAVIAAEPEASPLSGAVVAAARSAGDLVIAGIASGLAERLSVDRVVPSGARLPGAVRALQAEGRAVLLVSKGPGAALAAADCGIGVLDPDRRPPWGAHLFAGPDLADVCLLLDAAGAARTVSRRGALLAGYGSVAGALLALMGPRGGATSRALLGVNAAAAAGLAAGTWSALALARRPAPVGIDTNLWHTLEGAEAVRRLGSGPHGLSEAEAAARLAIRPQAAEAETPNLLRATLEDLANPLTPSLAAGAGIAAASGSVSDAALIGTVMGVNALIGGVQRVGTDRAIRRLADMSAVRVRLRRDGKEQEATAENIVPGDVILVQAGDAVPADCRILDETGLETDESSLTGESQLVRKSAEPSTAAHVADRRSMLYDGTAVAAGRATALVVAVGPETEAGRSAREMAGPKPVGGVQARLQKLVTATIPTAIASGAALLGLGFLRGQPPQQTLGTAVSLAVAAVPEGLPIVATVAQLASARRLSKRNALVRNPPTIETIGRVDTLCMDKTGTLTEGRIRLQLISDGQAVERVDALSEMGRAVLATGLRASPERVNGEAPPHPTDRAVVAAAQETGVLPATGVDGWELVDDVPFESGRGYHAALGNTSDGPRLVVKGAPEIVLPTCVAWRRGSEVQAMDQATLATIESEVNRLAGHGYRVLAVAERGASSRQDLTEDRVARLEFLGLLAFADQVRPTAAKAVLTLRRAGVDVIMITGDHPITAESIANELGIVNGRGVVTGAELDVLSDAELAELLPRVSVFARVTPAHKVRIVHALRARGHTVAMAGDGTNDAPAIRLADVGVALGRHGTNAAREAADVVVTDDRIETITDAIVEGRAMWASVRDAVAVLVGGNLGEIGFTLGAGLFSREGTPLNARQLLLVNLFTDILPSMALAVRQPENITPEIVLHEGPEASMGTALTRDILVRAGVTAASATGAWLVGRVTGTPTHASTVALVALVGAQLGQTLAVGWRSPLVVGASAVSGLTLGAVVQTPGVSQFFGCRPLGPVGWTTAVTAAAAGTAASLVVAPAIGGLERLARTAGATLRSRWPHPLWGKPGPAAAT
ncbi:HAD-IC family P-type ATPase [Actinopolymorpha alba]|uniref:HAD-IC family P-type ATPase n=1 Tax=Actinopolymorpha alba TaxID=533267 RepID=UPI00037C4E15|nr:HAD-IC family P-type ATPase [Actinopolymorpha alba]